MHNFPYPAILITLLIAISTWGFSTLGVFNPYDTVFYDLIMRYGLRLSEAPAVLLMTASEDELAAGDSVWLDVVEQLDTLGARQIIFTFTPKQVSSRFYERAARFDRLIFGRYLKISVQTDRLEITPWPTAARAVENQLTFGIVAIPPADHGVYRRHQAYYQIHNQDYPSLEVQAAQKLMGSHWTFPETEYWVNFSGGLAYLPMIALHRLLARELIPELVEGKSVVIGAALTPHEPGLHTPIDLRENQGISLAAFQGFALQTLLQKRALHPLPGLWQLVLLLVVTVFNVILYQLGHYQFGLWLTGAATGIYALTAWLLPLWWLVWPPVTALIIAQIGTFILVFRYKFHIEESTTRRLVLDLAGRLDEKLNLPSFYATPEPWTQVVTLVKQTLDLEWLIFLERFPGKYHVKEVIALNCTFNDIDERRRDYRRSPYSDAISENRPILLEHRLFFKEDPHIRQCMAPLVFGGELLGFWAMGIAREKVAAFPEFSTITHGFSQQIAEMLYHRQQWQGQQQAEKNRQAFRYLRLAGGENLHTLLRQIMTLHTQRLTGLKQIFDSIGTAAIFYNPFGRIIQVNQAMENLMMRGHLPGYEMTALDFINQLCKLSPSEGQHILQKLFIAHEATTLPASLPGDLHHHYLLHVRPVKVRTDQPFLESGDTEASHDAAPFQLRGILIELIDITNLHNLSELKSKLVERIYFQLNNDFQAILLASSLLAKYIKDFPIALNYMKSIEDQIDHSISLIGQAQNYLLNDLLDLHNIGCYPVSPTEPLQAALNVVAESLRERRLAINETLSNLTSLALADPDILQDILQTVLKILIEDAIIGANLSISIVEENGMITYQFADQGFGIPEAQFHDYLYGTGNEDTASLFGKLRVAILQVANWSGQLEGTSHLGTGLSFKLCLRCFI